MRTYFNHCSNFECWKQLPWSLFEVSLPRQVRLEVNTDHDCTESRWHFVRCRARYLRCEKSMHASVNPPDGQIVQHFWRCNLSKCCRSIHFSQSGGELIKQWHDGWDRNGRQFQRFAQCELHQEEKNFFTSWWSSPWAKHWNCLPFLS